MEHRDDPSAAAERAPPPSPLADVRLVLRGDGGSARAQVAAQPRAVAVISAFLDHALPKIWTLARACEANLLSLLPQLAARGVSSGIEPHYWRFQCGQGLVFAVKNDNLAMVEWLHSYCPSVLPYNAMIEATRMGNLPMLQWLSKRHVDAVFLPSMMDAAASTGQLEMLKWLHDHPKTNNHSKTSECNMRILTLAAQGGHLDMVKWIYEQQVVHEPFALEAVVAAILIRRSDVTKVLIEHSQPSDREFARVICAAAQVGDLEMIEWLSARSMQIFDDDLNPIDWAILSGQPLRIIQWLQIHCQVDYTTNTVGYAAQFGILELVQLLHEDHADGFTEDTMDWAAESGHLSTVRWLHENRPEGCTVKAMDWAAASGHLEVVQWLHANKEEGCSASAMNFAAMRGHLKVVKWLHENREEGCSADAMDLAAMSGHLEIVKWLHENRDEGCTEDAMDSASKYGHLEIIKWLHENRTEGCTVRAMDLTASNGHLNIVQWLHENRTEGCTTEAMQLAALGGHFDVVLYLRANRTEGCGLVAFDDVEACIKNMELVQWLHKHYPGSVDLESLARRGGLGSAVLDHIHAGRS